MLNSSPPPELLLICLICCVREIKISHPGPSYRPECYVGVRTDLQGTEKPDLRTRSHQGGPRLYTLYFLRSEGQDPALDTRADPVDCCALAFPCTQRPDTGSPPWLRSERVMARGRGRNRGIDAAPYKPLRRCCLWWSSRATRPTFHAFLAESSE